MDRQSTATRHITFPLPLLKDLKTENDNVNEERGTTTRHKNGETTEETILLLVDEAISLRKAARRIGRGSEETTVKVLGKSYTLIPK